MSEQASSKSLRYIAHIFSTHPDFEKMKSFMVEFAATYPETFNEIYDVVYNMNYTFTKAEDELTGEEKGQIFNGNRVQAIKSIRERTGLGLREAKEIADRYREEVDQLM